MVASEQGTLTHEQPCSHLQTISCTIELHNLSSVYTPSHLSVFFFCIILQCLFVLCLGHYGVGLVCVSKITNMTCNLATCFGPDKKLQQVKILHTGTFHQTLAKLQPACFHQTLAKLQPASPERTKLQLSAFSWPNSQHLPDNCQIIHPPDRNQYTACILQTGVNIQSAFSRQQPSHSLHPSDTSQVIDCILQTGAKSQPAFSKQESSHNLHSPDRSHSLHISFTQKSNYGLDYPDPVVCILQTKRSFGPWTPGRNLGTDYTSSRQEPNHSEHALNGTQLQPTETK